ncbi:DUF1848 domain-containing protein [Terasakiella sp. SH-1]|uniref:DUF1848 domain-containing protein n=1 Tax=Terasakiella sp. SH-1 TaxID=2560057 RepID=UPI00107346D7|nr:DUF1848 domain-containing protein [Terasakiella sp. SH-1]
MIISASRRTDIPAFYSNWFMNRIRAGFVKTRNPFNAKRVRTISLSPLDVDVIVFWTRNPSALMKHLTELDKRGFRYYFHYTITGYPRILERKTPDLNTAIQTFQALSDQLGPHRVIWRYDPVFLSSHSPLEHHIQTFSTIAQSLEGYTNRVVISLIDLYAKTTRNLDKIEQLSFTDLKVYNQIRDDLLHPLKEIAHTHQINMQSCAEETNLSSLSIPAGKCIDDDLIFQDFNIRLCNKKDKGQRKACRCIPSVDIGVYNSCLHGCEYCYATSNANRAQHNYQKHDPNGPFLIE